MIAQNKFLPGCHLVFSAHVSVLSRVASSSSPVLLLWMLILLMNSYSVHTITCHRVEYQIGNECCLMCLPGHHVRTDCTEFKSTSCLPCLEGTYMNKPTGLKHCFPCTNCLADSGLRIKEPCTPTSDALCEPLEGFYCVDYSDSDCNAAQKHRSCEPGQYISKKGTASTDTVCSDCSYGTFSDGTFTSCKPHTQCEANNLITLRPGTSSTDAECGDKGFIGLVIASLVLLVIFGVAAFISFLVKKCQKARENRKQRDGGVNGEVEAMALNIRSQ